MFRFIFTLHFKMQNLSLYEMFMEYKDLRIISIKIVFFYNLQGYYEAQIR